MTVSLEKDVWDKLSRIDVTEHADHLPKTGKRPAIAYLAWHKAWMLVKRTFPATTYSHRADIIHPDGTVEVEVDVNIAEVMNADKMFTNARLAVMDSYFNPTMNPTARQVNDARQRALVKALAFAGLGLNLWGEDIIPVGKLDDPIDADQHGILVDLIERTDSDVDAFLKWCEVTDLKDLPFERFRSALALLEAKARRIAKQKADAEKAAKK